MTENVVKTETLPNGDTVDTIEESDYRAPNPKDNPRNVSLNEIAKSVAKQHETEFAETAPSIDDEGNVTEAPTSTTEAREVPAADTSATAIAEPIAAKSAVEPESLDPNKLYDVVVHGQKIQVEGKKIIEAGISTVQKGSEADYRLKVASHLLEEAERRMAATTQTGGAQQPAQAQQGAPSEAELSNMLQYGTPEQAAQAVKHLRGSGVSSEQINELAAAAARNATRDEVAFQAGKTFLENEYGDLFAKDSLKNLFISEETRLRKAGDRRPYSDLYKAIGDSIRKDFNLQKPATATTVSAAPGTAAARQAVKAASPSVPRTAAARLEGAQPEKPKSAQDIIAGMQAARGKDRLSNPIRR